MSLIHKNLELGRERLDRGEYEAALTYIDAALAEDAASVDALQLRSRILYLMGQDAEALQLLRQVRAARLRGVAEEGADLSGEDETSGTEPVFDDDTSDIEALETLLALRERYTLDGELLMLLAELAEDAGRFQIARQVLREVTVTEPHRAEAWEGLVHVLTHEDLDAAAEVLQQALGRFPTHALFHEFAGFIHYRRGQFQRAITAYRQAIEYGADHTGNYQGMVLGYLALGEVEEALETTRGMLTRATDDADAHRFAVEVALQCETPEMATFHAHQLMRLQPTHAETYCYKAWVEIMQDDWETAERTLRLGFFKAMDGALALCMLVDLLLAIGQPEHALRVANIAIALAPDHPDAHASLGKALRELESYAEALQALRHAAVLAPQDDVYQTWIGIVLDNMGEYQAALRQFGAVLSRRPADVWTLCNRGLTYVALGDADRALADFNRCIDIDPQDGQPLFWRACTLAQRGDFDQALCDLRRALDISDEIYPWLEQEPLLAPLHDDPRFRELLAQADDED